MELWIRSQDKENLQKIEHLGVYGKKIYIDGNEEHGYCIAEYKTKERALEVLDDIQDKLINCTFCKKQNGLGEVLDFMPNSIYVYKMPID